MAGWDGIDPMDVTEMTEVEIATKLPVDEIISKHMSFKDPKAQKIALLKVINNVNKLANEILDDAIPKTSLRSFILRRFKHRQ